MDSARGINVFFEGLRLLEWFEREHPLNTRIFGQLGGEFQSALGQS